MHEKLYLEIKIYFRNNCPKSGILQGVQIGTEFQV